MVDVVLAIPADTTYSFAALSALAPVALLTWRTALAWLATRPSRTHRAWRTWRSFHEASGMGVAVERGQTAVTLLAARTWRSRRTRWTGLTLVALVAAWTWLALVLFVRESRLARLALER